MNTDNLLMILLNDNPDDAPISALELQKLKQTINLYQERCKMKDDLIRTLKSCLESFKSASDKNDDCVELLKWKLEQKNDTLMAVNKANHFQVVELENMIGEKLNQIVAKETIIKTKEACINQLNARHKKREKKLKERVKLCEHQISKLVAKLNENVKNAAPDKKKKRETGTNTHGDKLKPPQAEAQVAVKDWKNDIIMKTFVRDVQKTKVVPDPKERANKFERFHK